MSATCKPLFLVTCVSNVVVCNNDVSTCSQEFNAVHESKDEYKYRIGVCVDVDDTHPDCAVMQYEVDGDHRARCAGKVNKAQIARSKPRNSSMLCHDNVCGVRSRWCLD